MARHCVDARRLLCPMPVIRLQQAVKQGESGDVVELRCTDPGAQNDVPAWCRVHKHEVLSCEAQDGEILIEVLIKG